MKQDSKHHRFLLISFKLGFSFPLFPFDTHQVILNRKLKLYAPVLYRTKNDSYLMKYVDKELM